MFNTVVHSPKTFALASEATAMVFSKMLDMVSYSSTFDIEADQ